MDPSTVISTGTLPGAMGAPYYDIGSISAAAHSLGTPPLEIVLHPDWRHHPAPKSVQPSRWEESPYCSFDDLSRLIARDFESFSIPSVHGNRDLGYFLSSTSSKELELGRDLLLSQANMATCVGADLLVVHAWDPRMELPALDSAAEILDSVARDCRDVKLAVENIPVNGAAPSQPESLNGILEFSEYLWVTLDLSWITHHGSIHHFDFLLDRVANVHVQGRMKSGSTTMSMLARGTDEPIEPAILYLRDRGYAGQWTLELNRPTSPEDFKAARDHIGGILTS